MSITVTLSANAGVSLQFRSAKIWIDALHDTKMPGYSALGALQLRQMQDSAAFTDPDAMIFSHCHADHFSQSLAAKAMEKWPQAHVFLPESRLSGAEVLTGDTVKSRIGDVDITFVKMGHMGDHYADVAHYCVFLEEDGFTVLFAADTALGSKQLQAACLGRRIDAALMPFPWVTLRLGRRFIEKYIRPEHLLLLHLPFEGEDTEGYRAATEKYAPALADCPDVRILGSFLQQEII